MFFLTILSLALLAAGCALSAGGDEPLDPLAHPAFLTPVAQAQGEGITPYWMGEGFRAGSLAFGLNAKARVFYPYGDGPGLRLEYWAGIEGGRAAFSLQTYPAAGRTIPAIREEMLSIPGATSQEVRAGGWDG